jgi:hypothetical protein
LARYYLKLKGQAEKALEDEGFDRTSLFRPSLLVTKEKRYGWTGSFVQTLFPKVSWMLEDKYHEIPIEDLGKSMRINAENQGKGKEILHWSEFVKLVKGNK